MKEILFQIYFCFYIFWSPIIYSLLGSSGTELDGGLMRIILAALFAGSWFFYFWFSPKYLQELIMLVVLFFFACLYYSTQFFFNSVSPDIHSKYMGQLLRWGADCTSACALGMTLIKLKNYDLIHKVLPYECVALTPVLLMTILVNSVKSAQYSESSGLNYQDLAYYMAVLFCFSFYYAFIYRNKKNVLFKFIFVIIMSVQAVACCMAGGRGGVVLLVAYIVYMGYYLLKRKIVTTSKLVVITILGIAVFLFVANQLDMWSSAGFRRSSSISTDDDRFEMWSEYIPYFWEKPLLGNGLGSDYFTWGFYSHNLIVDFLVEIGILGTLLMIVLYWKTYKSVFLLSKYNEIFIIIMILFIYGCVMNMFSGYWITTSSIWMSFGIAISCKNYFKRHYFTVTIQRLSHATQGHAMKLLRSVISYRGTTILFHKKPRP